MKRADILASLTGILAQRPKPKMRDAATAPKGSADWCRFTNASAGELRIDIYNEIGFWGTTADDFVKQLNSVEAQKIHVHINSEGGEVFDGVAIHTALAQHPAHVTAHIDGLAASAASFIAMSADDIIMARNATMMVHDAAGMTWGNEADHLKSAALLGKLSDNIADMYALQADGTVAQWREIMRAETWYTGQEALAAGLVDHITGDEPEEAPSNMLSMMFFNYASRAEAPAPPVLPKVEDVPVTETVDYARAQAMAFLAASMKA